MKISIFRRWPHFHNEGLHSQIFHFLDIFWRSLHFFPQKISSLWDQPFCFSAKNTLSIDIFQVAKYLLENICSLSTFEKGLRCFRPKMSTHWFFTFKCLYFLWCYGLTHSAMIGGWFVFAVAVSLIAGLLFAAQCMTTQNSEWPFFQLLSEWSV